MSDYLRSALGYLNGNGNSNEYVGQILEINNVKLRVNRLLAEGESVNPPTFFLYSSFFSPTIERNLSELFQIALDNTFLQLFLTFSNLFDMCQK